jgi:hypothetical protein
MQHDFGLIRGVASLEWDNFVAFYFINATEIWYDEKVGFLLKVVL